MSFLIKRYFALIVVLFAPLIFSDSFGAQPEEIEVYSHRGVRSYFPENTLPGVDASLRIGTDWVDVDVVLTKDGEVLVSHDPVLNPNIVRDAAGKFLSRGADFNQKYAVRNQTLDELQKFDVGRLNRDSDYSKFFPKQTAIDGTRMPTLRDVIQHVKKTTGKKVGFQIEMKTDPAHPEYSADPEVFAAKLHKILQDEGVVERSEIQAFDFRCLRALQHLDPHVKTAYLTSRDNERGGVDDFFHSDSAIAKLWTGGPEIKDYGNSIPRMVKELGGYAWEPEDAQLTLESLTEAHRLGLKVVVWTWPEMLGTAFSPEMVEKMIKWGVDGIITDDPARLNAMLAAHGAVVPKRYGPGCFRAAVERIVP